MRSLALALSFAGIGALLFACSGSTNSNGFSDTTGSGGGGGGGGPGGGGFGTGNTDGGGGGGGGGSMPQQVDKTAACDTGLAVDGDAAAFAKSIGICTTAAKDGYGLVSATYSKAFGSGSAPAKGQWGLLPQFGSAIKPREGSTLGVLSSGIAREYDDINGGTTEFVKGLPLYLFGGSPAGTAPPGFPKKAMGCDQDSKVNDMINVKLTLTAPKDATGFQFDFDFYSSEWPNYVCSNFNDAFIAYLTSNKVAGDNISFDSNNNPVAVNNNFLNRCTPNTGVGCDGKGAGKPISTAACAGKETELQGTGYGATASTDCTTKQKATVGGATGWLTTQAPVAPGETFTIEFMIWDAGDEALDSSVLIDNFQWIGGNVSTGTTRVN